MRAFHALSASFLVIALCGCGLGSNPSTTGNTAPVTGLGIHGKAHGGQQALNGSTVQLWTAGSSGYGLGAQTLGSSVLTLEDGSFSITGKYTCPAYGTGMGPATPVYLTVSGGDPGGGVNPQLLLMTALGACSSLSSTQFISIDEVSTVAAAYALAQFMDANGNIGYYGYGNNSGFTNAFSTAANLVSIASGLANTAPIGGNGVVPQTEINALANILAACVNSQGGSAGDHTPCGDLFDAVTPLHGAAPANTMAAILDIALHPTNNVANIYDLAFGDTVFSPALTSPPNDWSMAVSYVDGGSFPTSIAVDNTGNIWVTNCGSNCGSTGSDTGSVSLLSNVGVSYVPYTPPFGPPSGSPSPFTANFDQPNAVAVDVAGDAWITNLGNNSVVGTTFDPGGFALYGPFVNGDSSGIDLNHPSAIAIDGTGFNGAVWIVNSGDNSLTSLSQDPSSGNYGAINHPESANLNAPAAIAVDASDDLWIGNAGTLTKLKNDASLIGNYTASSLSGAKSVAINGSDDIWVSNGGGLNLTEFNGVDGSELSTNPTGFTGGGLATGGSGVAIDGSSNVWAIATSCSCIAEFGSDGTPLSPSTGFQGGNLSSPSSIAIDSSGNVWVANDVAGATSNNVTEFIGLASPAITPLASAIAQNQVGERPGTPIPVNVISDILPFYSASFTYNAQLAASGGNSGMFTWTLASGSLPTGLTLSSAGLISGTTALTGTYPITVTACDALGATNCVTSVQLALISTDSIPAGGSESQLSGSYAVRFSGFQNNTSGPYYTPSGQVTGTAFIGSLVFNGGSGSQGLITNGSVDVMSPNSTSIGTFANVTGYYTLGSDRRGFMVITGTSSGPISPLEFAISVGNINGGVAGTINLAEFDDTTAETGVTSGTVGSGIAKLQTSAAFTAGTLEQGFAFGLQGETPCSNTYGDLPDCAQSSVTPFGPLSVAGYFAGDVSGNTTGEEDAAAFNTSYPGVNLSGSYTSPDSTFGRGTFTLTPGSSVYPDPPADFVYYVVNAGELFLLSADGHATNSMLTGDALAQSGTFTNATMSGTYIGYEYSPETASYNLSNYPTVASAGVYMLAVDAGHTQFTVTGDQNNGGVVKLNQSQGSLNYSMDAHGRIALGDGGPTFYMASSAAGFGTEQPTNPGSGGVNPPGMITIEQQQGTNFTYANLGGTYALNTIASPVPSNYVSGVITLPGTDNTGNATVDESEEGSALIYAVPENFTLDIDSTTGRGTAVDQYGYSDVIYIISDHEAVLLDTNSGDVLPTIIHVQQ